MDELARWQACGKRLWPFVRLFCLAGADPEAIAAVVELADLLGEKAEYQISQDQVDCLMDDVRQKTIAEFCERVQSSREIAEGYGIAGAKGLANILRSMADEGHL